MHLLPRIMGPAILVLAGMAVTSCGTTFTLEESVPAIINVHRNDTLAILYDNDTGREIASRIGSHLAPGNFIGLPSDFYRSLSRSPQESPNPSVADADVLVMLSKSSKSCSTEYETVESKDRHGKTVKEERIASSDSHSRVTCRFTTRHQSSALDRDYTASYSDSSSVTSSHMSIIKLAEKIARDIVPHQRTYMVTIDSDNENPALEQAAEACKAGNWILGEQLAKQAAAHKPQSAEAQFLMGIIERHKNNLSRSSELIAKAASLQADDKYDKELQRNAAIPGNIKKIRQQLKPKR